MKVQLVDGDKSVAEAPVAVAIHDQTQLVVGVVAENPAKIVGELDLPANQNSVAPVIATLTPADLPERIQAWAAIDRLIWQDTDASTLTSGAARRAPDLDRGRRAAGHRRRHRRRGHRWPPSPTTSSPTGRPPSSTSTRRRCARSSARRPEGATP